MAKLVVGQQKTYRIQKDAMAEFGQSRKAFRRGFYKLDADTIIWFPKLVDGNVPQSPFMDVMKQNGDIIEETSPNQDKFDKVKKFVRFPRITFPADPKKPYRFEGVYEVDKIDNAKLRITYKRISKTVDTTPWIQKGTAL